jgi:hypothetical protein
VGIAFSTYMGLLSPPCFYLNSKNEYFGICTTWGNNNNGLRVNSRINLEIIGPKISNP